MTSSNKPGMRRDDVLNLFRYSHLPAHLRTVSKPFCAIALAILDEIPASPEQTLAIRKLWEVKNLVVYAAVAASNAGSY